MVKARTNTPSETPEEGPKKKRTHNYPKNPKRNTYLDWDYVEPLFKSGLMTLAEIVRQYNADHKNSGVFKKTITEAAIRQRGQKLHWVRDLTDQVRQRVRHNILRDDAEDSEPNLTDTEIIERAAKLPTIIRKDQRRRAIDLAKTGDELKLWLDTELGKDPREITITGAAQVYNTLISARQKLQAMESEAFGLEGIDAEEVQGITVEFVEAKKR